MQNNHNKRLIAHVKMFTMHHAAKEIHISSSFDETLLNFFDNEEIG